MGVWNTGYQANIALARLGLDSVEGWRGDVVSLVGSGYAADSVAAAVVHGALYLFPLLIVAAGVTFAWEWLFAHARGRVMGEGTLVTALVFTLLLPPATPLWQCALGASFAMVFGKLIFGGTGRNFLNPALTGLAFLYFSFPTQMVDHPLWPHVVGYAGTTAYALAAGGGMPALEAAGFTWTDAFVGRVPGLLGPTSVIACALGATVLILKGIASWRVMAAVLIGTALTALAFNLAAGDAPSALGVPWHWHLVLGGVAFGAVFVATDPVSAPMTDPGRWIYGALIGAAVVLVRLANPAHPDGVLLAILLGNISAPLIDHAMVRVAVRRRANRKVRAGA